MNALTAAQHEHDPPCPATEVGDHVDPGDRPRVAWFTCGAALGAAPYLYVLLAAGWTIFPHVPGSDRFDAQAHSLANGRLDIDPAIATIEGFNSHGRTYLYFGLFPSILRLPVVLFTDGFDGRLGTVSVLVAAVVTVCAVRALVGDLGTGPRWGDRDSRLACALFGLLGAVVSGGSVLTYLANRGSNYHEAIAWGIAGATAAGAFLIRFQRTARLLDFWLASVAAVIAIQSRVTVGVGAAACLGIVAATTWFPRLGTPPLRAGTISLRQRLIIVALAVAPLVTFAAVQVAKFGSLTVHPSQHVANQDSEHFATYERTVGDTYFSPQFVPANVIAMSLWPSRLDVDAEFPWLEPVESALPPTPGGPLFLGRVWTGSLLATQTFLLALGAAGAIVLLRHRRNSADPGETAQLTAAIPVALGLTVGLAPTVAYAYQYHRSLGDTLPLVLLLAVLGVVSVPQLVGSQRRFRHLAMGIAGLLAAWSVWVNVALAVIDQSERSWAPRPAVLARLVDARLDVGSDLEAESVAIDGAIPVPLDTGELLIIGECDAMFMSAGQDGFGVSWWPVELNAPFKRTFRFSGSDLREARVVPIVRDSSAPERVLELARSGASIAVGLAGEPAALVLSDAGMHEVTVTYDPFWSVLRLAYEDEAAVVPWSGTMKAVRSGSSVVDAGGDGRELCSRVADRGR